MTLSCFLQLAAPQDYVVGIITKGNIGSDAQGIANNISGSLSEQYCPMTVMKIS